MTRKSDARQRYLNHAELGTGRTPLWRPHNTIKNVLVRETAHGQEMRLLLYNITTIARDEFLRKQEQALAEFKPKRIDLHDTKWIDRESGEEL